MSIIRSTELGEVKISDQVIARIISDAMSSDDIADDIWPSTERGFQIGLLPKLVDAEFASNIETQLTEEGIELEFSVIVRFGASIKQTTRILADRVHDDMRYILGIAPSVITINIAGVKSKQTARRNTKAVYRYEAD